MSLFRPRVQQVHAHQIEAWMSDCRTLPAPARRSVWAWVWEVLR